MNIRIKKLELEETISNLVPERKRLRELRREDEKDEVLKTCQTDVVNELNNLYIELDTIDKIIQLEQKRSILIDENRTLFNNIKNNDVSYDNFEDNIQVKEYEESIIEIKEIKEEIEELNKKLR